MRCLLLVLAALSSAAVAQQSPQQLISRILAHDNYVALIIGDGGEAPLLSASFRCVPGTDRFYMREYDDDRQGMAGEIPDNYWTDRGFERVEPCDEICALDAAPFGNQNDWSWRRRISLVEMNQELDDLLSAEAIDGATSSSLAARRQAIEEFRSSCGYGM